MDRYEILWHSLKFDLLGEVHDLINAPMDVMSLDYIARERILEYVLNKMKAMERRQEVGAE